jgi:hypothetical protein
LRRGVLRSGFGIGFHGEALHGLQSGGNGFLVRFGPPHFRIKALVDFAEGGIVRANARWRVFGIRRRDGAGWLREFLISLSIHDLDRVPNESG